ncbi:M61 glycyl aminopeptidase [Posidoniimonas corsicana]|uniref:M61 glycyl aminopeptidase n=1 Tax=Posidoniimonas corsicana TaxID=1938618 RepID=A0A5C5V5W9_9BACT|nr:hypothetical protein [Posidoniimonas corsicana]TWT33938.1 M61 glycyl aminopeptidase [Posidoniimonas corsicana]
MNARTAFLLTLLAVPCGAAPPDVELAIDATQAQRGLLSSEMSLPVSAGDRYFWHPNWAPGVTGPTEQVSNLVGLVFEDEFGQPLRWRRDPTRANLFCVSVPDGVARLTVKLKYVMNQPARLSSSVDCYGTPDLLVINFNACLLYPDCDAPARLSYRTRVSLPDGFQHGCALTAKQGPEGVLDFGAVGLAELIDSPLAAGRFARELTTAGPGAPDARFFLLGESPECLSISPDRERQLSRILPEATRLFGSAPFTEYTFLILCTNDLPRFGLEHRGCSLMVLRPDALQDDQVYSYRGAYLLPHELAHAWCGKHRTPRGMQSDNFHTPVDTELLWVYEGLTQYLMQLIAVRSGQVDADYHLGYLADRVAEQARRDGRAWRSLADTAVAARTLRGQDAQWRGLRRAQDYYDEGALFWLRVDCLLRASSDGRASLDEFCREFFHAEAGATPTGFDVDEIVTTLDSLSPGDWRGLIERLIYQPRDTLDLEVLQLAGYRLAEGDRRPACLDAYEKVWGFATAESSIGLVADKRGEIRRVVEGAAAAAAGLTDRADIVAVNGRAFSRSRLRAAVEASEPDRPIELIVRQDGRVHTCTLPYNGGPRYPILERRDETPDRLRAILRPLPATPPARLPVAEETKPRARSAS